MKKSLFVLFLVAFFSLVSAQQMDPERVPNRPADYPPVPASCKNKVKLYVSNASGRSVRFPDTVQCGFDTYACGKFEKFRSNERPSEQGACNAFQLAATALQNAGIEVCCDPPEEAEKPEPKKKCEDPTPWFDGLSPDRKCKDRQEFKTSDDGNGVVFLEVCGWRVFRHKLLDKDPLLVQAYTTVLLDHVRGRVGSTICCDSFKAARGGSGSSCNPQFDLDCDGISNPTDTTEPGDLNQLRFPDINTYGIADGVRAGDIVPHPPWFKPGDPGFMPPANLCDCKWEVKSARRECNLYGGRRHAYQLTWRCPSTGNVKFTRKEVPATEPCGPAPGGTMISRYLIPYYYQLISGVWALVPRITPTRSYSRASVVRRFESE